MKFIIKQRFNIGIVLLLLSTPITNLIAFVTNKNTSKLTDVFLLIALICIADFKSLRKFKFYFSKIQMYFFIYSLGILLISIISGYSFNSGRGAVIYNLLTLALILVISSNNK